MKQFKQFKTRTVLDDVCEIHGCHLWSVKILIKGKVEEINQCPECEKENIRRFEKQLNMESEVKSKLSDTYEVFARDSIVSSKLASKSLHDYEIRVDIDENAMNFVKRLERYYAKGETGNAIITGPSGVGKSHLTYGLARFLNEQFKSYDEPKSVLFVSVVTLKVLSLTMDFQKLRWSSYCLRLISSSWMTLGKRVVRLTRSGTSGRIRYCSRLWIIGAIRLSTRI